MNLEDMDLKQVIERIAELDEQVRGAAEVTVIDTATEEKKGLLERKAELETMEKRRQDALDLELGNKSGKKKEERKEEKHMENIFDRSSEQYRVAWLKNLQGAELTEIEKRAGLTATAAMPEQTMNKVVEKMVDMVPLLREIELFQIPGNINIAVESVAPSGTREAAGGEATLATATLTQVSLTGYNINSFIRVGADLAQMAVPAFEDWLVRKLAEAIAYKIEDFIVNGDGDGDPKGIENYVASWGVTAGTGIDATGSNDVFTVANIDSLIGLVPAAYDRESKFLMSKKTFYTSIASLQDENNWALITRENNKFYLRGYEVIFSDAVTLDDVFFGSFKRGMVGNLSTEIKVEKQRNLAYNCWDFLGWGVFDCKPAAAGCIVKLAADVAA